MPPGPSQHETAWPAPSQQSSSDKPFPEGSPSPALETHWLYNPTTLFFQNVLHVRGGATVGHTLDQSNSQTGQMNDALPSGHLCFGSCSNLILLFLSTSNYLVPQECLQYMLSINLSCPPLIPVPCLWHGCPLLQTPDRCSVSLPGHPLAVSCLTPACLPLYCQLQKPVPIITAEVNL